MASFSNHADKVYNVLIQWYMSIYVSRNFVKKKVQLNPNVTLHSYIKYFPYTFEMWLIKLCNYEKNSRIKDKWRKPESYILMKYSVINRYFD